MKAFIDIKSCFGLHPVDRLCHIGDSEARAMGYKDFSDMQLQQARASERSGGGGGGGQAPAPADPIETAKKLRAFTIESNQPAITSLQSSIPETDTKFNTESARLIGEKEPLKQRYAALLGELKGRESTQTKTAQVSAAREFGRRGVPLSSSSYDDFLGEKVNPISQFYGGEIKNLGLDEESSLRGLENLIAGLPAQSTEAKRAIMNAIASLQTGDPASSITGALGITQQQQQAQQAAQQLALQQQIAADENKYRNAQLDYQKSQTASPYATLSEGQSLYNLLTGQQMFKNPKTYKASVGGDDGW